MAKTIIYLVYVDYWESDTEAYIFSTYEKARAFFNKLLKSAEVKSIKEDGGTITATVFRGANDHHTLKSYMLDTEKEIHE